MTTRKQAEGHLKGKESSELGTTQNPHSSECDPRCFSIPEMSLASPPLPISNLIFHRFRKGELEREADSAGPSPSCVGRDRKKNSVLFLAAVRSCVRTGGTGQSRIGMDAPAAPGKDAHLI